jgi:hypothetical protein
MADEHEIDEQIVAVLNEVLDAVYQAKQAAWSASTSPAREDLRELVAFLIDQSGRLMVAEERLGGRSPEVSSPSSHQRGNLVAEAHGDHRNAVALLAQRLSAIAGDVRARAASVPGAAETSMLSELADGLEARVERLEEQ